MASDCGAPPDGSNMPASITLTKQKFDTLVPGLNVPQISRPLLPDLKLEAASEFEAFKYLFQ
jgi:hypothetical protein